MPPMDNKKGVIFNEEPLDLIMILTDNEFMKMRAIVIVIQTLLCDCESVWDRKPHIDGQERVCKLEMLMS